ncbi:winged helix-turn-helix domain-containing protein [Methylobacterium sp. J-076]|uniref:winged helix-turn-helix domain-containing protein n=1 Tax=Methylobacterium sp. J-076 TaxID=2836655 RepID=UPI001FBBF5D6|nr:winged helix-turn-helix domain-containing protein [Methylobacterium sp. J-076]MCJ2012635.1 winged helix-turn-helix domain-containing protein [Methylobacterium sp. J-076]
MSLSEHDAEERLAQLRRQREALDREIADLVLYLELGRRLKAGPSPAPAPSPAEERPEAVPAAAPVAAWGMPAAPVPAADPPARPRRQGAPEPVAFAEDPTGARRYGRALVEAACAVLAGAGRPLHAREIHDALIGRGFAIPGRDPVAALNTRLWKRAGEGGPLRRHGEAVYGLAEE